MTAEEAMRAIEYYKLTLFAPTGNGVRPDCKWYACNSDRSRYGFGPTPIEAIEAADKYEPPEEQEDLILVGDGRHFVKESA